MKRGVAVLAFGLLLAGCGGSSEQSAAPSSPEPTEPKTLNVFVTFKLTDARTAVNGCVGTGGYDDIAPGTQVTLADQDGGILAVSELGTGTGAYEGNSAACRWEVAMDDVPADATFYSLEVGDRGEITKSADEVTGGTLQFDVSLG